MTSTNQEIRRASITKNTAGLFVFRGLSFVANILLVPLSLKLLGTSCYGIWIALSSIGGWIGVLDLGIGNGLRNKLSESLALNDDKCSREYISSAYFSLGAFAVCSTLIVLTINFFLDWQNILHVPIVLQGSLSGVTVVVFSFLGVRLAAGLISSILLADQQPSIVGLIDALGSVVTLGSVLMLTRFSGVSLFAFAVASSYGPVIVLLAATSWLFVKRYSRISPRWDHFNPSFAMQMASLGTKFFVLQISALVVFSTTGLLIARLYGPDEVARYAVAQRYFGIPLTGFAILLTPYWSAYTQAYVLRETQWIRRSIRTLRLLFALTVLGVALMVGLSGDVYRAWVGTSAIPPLSLSVAFAVYVLMASWCSIHVNLINGTGKVHLQLVVAVVSAICFVPVALVLPTFGMNGSSVIMAAVCLILAPSCVLWPIQASRLLKGGEIGIWGR